MSENATTYDPTDARPQLRPRMTLDATIAKRLEEACGLFTPSARLAALARDPRRRVRMAVVDNQRAPKAALDALVADPSAEIRERLASRRALSDEQAWVLSVDAAVAVRCALAARAELHEDIRVSLAGDRDARVRAAVAGNVSTPAHLLAALARDRAAAVRDEVYANPACPQEARAIVVEQRPTARTLAIAAGSPFATPDELTELARARTWSVRAEVARNDATPAEVILRLTADRSREVRALAAIRAVEAGWIAATDAAPVLLLARPRRDLLVDALETTESPALLDLALAVGHREYLLAAAQSRCATPGQMRRIMAAGWPAARHALTLNPRTPAELLHELAQDPWVEVHFTGRFTGAGDPGIVCVGLWDWCDRRVFFAPDVAVARHHRAAEFTLDLLARHRVGPVAVALAQRCDRERLPDLARSRDHNVRAAVAGNQCASREILKALAADVSWYVREAVQHNPVSGIEIVELAEAWDVEYECRQAAERKDFATWEDECGSPHISEVDPDSTG